MSKSDQSEASVPPKKAAVRHGFAAGQANSADSDVVLATLCETYWHPLYAYLRLQGHDSAEARNLPQGFVVRPLEKKYLQQIRSLFDAICS